MGDEPMDDDAVADPTASEDTASVPDAESEDLTPYRRRVGITLAILALLGGWIAVLETNASTNESRTTREATRLASEAQTARVLNTGVEAAVNEIGAVRSTYGDRAVFDVTVEEGIGEGMSLLDDDERAALIAEGEASISSAIGDTDAVVTKAATDARQLTLEHAAVVDQRITWNARSSQYQTVLTTLAVAVFLIGFTLVVGRRLRPPFAAPGLLLALFCFGWALQIYNKPIPDVAPGAIDATAVGQVALEQQRPDDAADAFRDAIDVDDGYAPAWAGLATALMVDANPDLRTTFALTDVSPAIVGEATDAIDRALEIEPTDRTNQGLAGIIAIAAADWDEAAERLDGAIEGNDLAPGLQLARGAVAVAQGDEATADAMVDLVKAQASDLASTSTARTLTAQYLTILDWVAQQEPDRAALAERYRDEGVVATTASLGGLTDPPPGATPSLDVVAAEFADGQTFLDIDVEGVAADAQVAVIGYELPAPGASLVQPPLLFIVGPPSAAAGVTLTTPQACAPLQFRFDLYVGDERVDSVEAPGAEATC